MTAKIDALRALKAAVEAGEFPGDVSARDLGVPDAQIAILTFYEAFSGSLDAAKALHEAVLPAYRFRIEDFRAEVWHGPTGPFIAAHEIPARAWLLAQLAALIAQEEAR